MNTVYTTCRYCEAACGLAVQVRDNKVEKIVADKENPQTWRDICAKGLTAHELVEHPRRIKAPMKRVGNSFVETTYEEAISAIAGRFNELIADNGADSIGYYHGNPLGFTSGVIFSLGWVDAVGTQNRYNVGSIDQNNNHVVSSALFDLPYVPFNPDIDRCDYLLMIGMNPAESKFSWLGSASDGWARAREKQTQGTTLVVVDPRRTRSAQQADTHLNIKPGTDWAFILGLLHTVFGEDLADPDACAALPAEQLESIRSIALAADLTHLSRRCGIAVEDIRQVARDYAQATGAMCLTQTGVSMHTTGTVGHWLGLVLDIVTGHLDKPGGRRFDTGYINMTEFAATGHQPETISRVRGQPTVMGNRSLAELPDEIQTPGPGQIKAMVIQSGNPVVSGPNGRLLDNALAGLDMLVAVDLVQRESHRHADWLIPGVHWLEREELSFNLAGGMDQPFAQYSAQAVNPPESIRPEWAFFVDLSLAMKVPFMGKKGANTMIRISRVLARLFRKPQWAVSPGLLERLMLKGGKTFSWRQLQNSPHGLQYRDRAYGQLKAQMGGKAIQIAPGKFCTQLQRLLDESEQPGADYPFTLIGKRTLHMMNSWLMELPNMQKREQGNDCEVHPQDAHSLGIQEGAEIEVTSAVGSICIKARISDRVVPGIICIQHGWGSRVFSPANKEEPLCYGVNVNDLVDNAEIDPFSGIPNLNSTRVKIRVC
ncbi:MAG: molybdopterin-dependent oxidoreductase [Halioglobus sp.]